MLSEHSVPSIVTAATEPLTEGEAAARLGLKIATLRAWRHQRRGPTFLRLGRAIRYLSTDLDEFVQANRHQSTPNASE